MDAGTFFANFEAIANAPGGVAQLRALILDLAMQGKLVEQDPEEKPASVPSPTSSSSNQPRKRSRKRKQLKDVTPDEQPFEPPEGWLWVRLGKAARLRRGFDLPVRKRVPGHVPVYGSNGPLGTHNEVGIRGPGVVTGRSGSIGKVHYVPGVFWPLNTALYVEDFFGNDPRFIELMLKYVNLQRFSSYSAVPTLNRNVAHEEPVLVPPFAEQIRIVARFDELMALCDDLEAQQQHRNTLQTQFRASALDALMQAEDGDDLDQAWARIREHWADLTDHPDCVDEIRQVILQLAVRGKLVEQDPDDEPASVLLEHIAAEKARLVKEKKLRKPKKLPPFNQQDVPFSVPSGWSWCYLNDTGAIGTGTTPSTSNTEYYSNGSIPWVSSSLTGKDLIETGTSNITMLAVRECRLRIYPPGSLIVALYGQGKTRGQVAWLGIHAAVNQACAAIEPVLDVEPLHRYLMLVLQRNYNKLRLKAAGGAQPNLNLGKLASMLVPLPPLAEQYRIVARVNELMALCDDLEQHLKQTHHLREALAGAATHAVVQLGG